MSVYEIFVHGAEQWKHVVSVEVSTPKAKSYIDALLSSALFDVSECTLSSRELRAIAGNESLAEVTQPMIEPAPDVIEDLWQMSHVTASYVGRAAGGAILLADGILHNSAISIVVAALFLPFLSPVLAVGFGARCGDAGLVRNGSAALLTSTVLAYAAGALVAGGPIAFHDFKGQRASFAISAVIGAAAGLSTAGRRGPAISDWRRGGGAVRSLSGMAGRCHGDRISVRTRCRDSNCDASDQYRDDFRVGSGGLRFPGAAKRRTQASDLAAAPGCRVASNSSYGRRPGTCSRIASSPTRSRSEQKSNDEGRNIGAVPLRSL